MSTLALVAACKSERKARPKPKAEPAAEKLRLVVVITIDQLPSWTFDSNRALLGGGIKTLLDRGLYIPEAEFPYANTYTAPGHATIATGAPPSVTGILANSWYRSEEGRPSSCVYDHAHRIYGVGRGDEMGVSSRALRVDGIADVLEKSSSGRSKSVAVALKDRGAILLLGRKPDMAVWYEDSIPGMTTSSFYADSLPPWLQKFNGDQPLTRYYQSIWTPLDPALLERETTVADDSEGEGKSFGFDRTFPHDLSKTDKPTAALRMTPIGTRLIFESARAAVVGEKLGADGDVDLLGLSMSSHDYAGHYWGQESWERLDLLMRLDLDLDDFLSFLDERVGADRYAVLVTSDHGANPLIENVRKRGLEAHRVSTIQLVRTAAKAAAEVLGPGRWVYACSASTVYLSPKLDALPEGKKDEAVQAMVLALSRVPGLGYVKTSDELRGNCDKRAGLDALACRSISDESGQIFVAPTFGSTLSSGYTTGTSHGSPSREDRFVPIIVAVPGGKKAEHAGKVSMLQVAPTLARLLGIAPPESAKMPAIDASYFSAFPVAPAR